MNYILQHYNVFAVEETFKNLDLIIVYIVGIFYQGDGVDISLQNSRNIG